MGAGLAAQRGWPENDPQSPGSSSEDTSGDGLVLHQNGRVPDEIQPLADGDGWGYQSVGSVRSLAPMERRLSIITAGDDVEARDGRSESDVTRHSMDSNTRRMSTAYDLGELETEEEIRRRFHFMPREGFSAERAVAKVKRKIGKEFSTPRAVLNTFLPITRQLQSYNVDKMSHDVIVGVTMATLMIPQGLSFATVAGIPLMYGLYIVWAPPFFYSLFGVSLHVSYGPFALMGLFMSDALGKRGYKPCDGLCREHNEHVQEYLEACTIITFMVSMWYFLMALFKLGEPLAILLADPVISGFVTGSALLVANSQVCIFFQIEHPDGRGKGIIGTVQNVWESSDQINWGAVGVGVSAMVVYFALRRANTHLRQKGVTGFFLPEALLVVIISTLVSWLVDLHSLFGVDIVGDLPPGLPYPTLPRLDKLTSFEQMKDMAGVALVAAIVSFIITHSIAKSLAGASEVKATPQLFAFGVANLAGSVLSALPGSASLSRAAIIDALGARTIVHNVFTFILMTFVLLFMSPLLKFLPTSVLAATIFAVIYKFFHFGEPFRLYRVSVTDMIMWLATFGATLGVSVKNGIVVGMAVSAFTLIQRSSSPVVMQLGRLPGTDLYRNIKAFPDAVKIPGVEVMRFGSSLTFANKDVFRRAVIKLVERSDNEMRLAAKQGLPQKPPLQYLILDSSSIHDMDSSSLRMLEALVALLLDRPQPIEMFLAPVSDPLVEQIMKSAMLCRTLGQRYFLGIAPAVQYAQEQISAGMLVAPPDLYKRAVSNLSLANLDEEHLHDI